MSIAVAPRAKGRPNYLTGTMPQVNLLPPETRAARGLVHTKKWLGAALVIVVVASALGYLGALAIGAAATTELEEVQLQSARLQLETEKYSEVPVVVNHLTRGTDARALGMAPEILWKGYVDAITAVLPADVSIQNFALTQQTPSALALAPADLLSAQGVATVTFTSVARTLPTDASWLDALNAVPGFYGATFSTLALGAEDGVTSYNVTSTVQVNETAFAGRFTEKKGN